MIETQRSFYETFELRPQSARASGFDPVLEVLSCCTDIYLKLRNKFRKRV
jgi:hypothetical protein